MQLIFDSEGISFEYGDGHYYTFLWNTCLLAVYSSRHNRSFFTVFHLWLALLSQWLIRPKADDVVQLGTTYQSSGSVALYSVTNVVGHELARGNMNFMVCLLTPELEDFIMMLKDYRALPGIANGFVVIRCETKEAIAPLYSALMKVNAVLITAVVDGEELTFESESD